MGVFLCSGGLRWCLLARIKTGLQGWFVENNKKKYHKKLLCESKSKYMGLFKIQKAQPITHNPQKK